MPDKNEEKEKAESDKVALAGDNWMADDIGGGGAEGG